MHRPLLGRIALVVAAVLVIGWQATGLWSLDRLDDGKDELKMGGDPAALGRARADFRAAGRFRAGTEPLVEEGAGLVLTRRPDQARGPLERAVRAEPENFQAWYLLYAATLRRDPARAREARRRALALNSRPPQLLQRSVPRP